MMNYKIYVSDNKNDADFANSKQLVGFYDCRITLIRLMRMYLPTVVGLVRRVAGRVVIRRNRVVIIYALSDHTVFVAFIDGDVKLGKNGRFAHFHSLDAIRVYGSVAWHLFKLKSYSACVVGSKLESVYLLKVRVRDDIESVRRERVVLDPEAIRVYFTRVTDFTRVGF